MRATSAWITASFRRLLPPSLPRWFRSRPGTCPASQDSHLRRRAYLLVFSQIPSNLRAPNFGPLVSNLNQDGGFMRKLACCLCAGVFLLCGSFLYATIFGKIQGIV